MDPEKILLFSISGFSFIILFILLILFLLERKKIKEKITEEATRLEKIINEHSKQTVILIDGLKNELKKLRLDFIDNIEIVNSKIRNSEETLIKSVKQIERDLDTYQNEMEKNLNEGFKQLNKDLNRFEEINNKRLKTLDSDIEKKFKNLINELDKLTNQTKEFHNQINNKISNIEKHLKEPIDIEEWINES